LATVLAGVAEETTKIDVARAQAAKEAAEAEIAELTRGDHTHASLGSAQAALARAELRLAAAK